LSKEKFIQALHENSLDIIKSIPKSDLHSHAGRGGTISYIEQWANVRIIPPAEPFDSLREMNQWLNDNVKIHCPGVSGYLKRVEAAFAQAKNDNIKVLAMSYGIDEIDSLGTIDEFINIMNGLHRRFAPDTAFYPELALGYKQDKDAGQSRIDEIFEASNNGTLEEVFGTGTAAVISPVGQLRWEQHIMPVQDGGIGPVSQKLYDTITGIQLGKIKDNHNWTVVV
jgi:hypothetical protein